MLTMKPDLKLVVDAQNYLGESPVWSVNDHLLYWINCERSPELHRWNPQSGEHKIWPMPERIGGFALKAGGGALIALANGMYELDFGTDSLTSSVKSPMVHAALHESACDRQGRLWIGAIDHQLFDPDFVPGRGALFRLEGKNFIKMVDGISCSNGLAFSPDGRTMYHSDTLTLIVNAWDFEPASGELTNKREFIKLADGEGYCDGATVDAEGGYWMSLVGGSRLRRYLHNGTLDMEVELPFNAPTKLAFGGDDMSTIYITTTRMLPKDESQLPISTLLGGVYSFRPGVKGIPEPLLAG